MGNLEGVIRHEAQLTFLPRVKVTVRPINDRRKVRAGHKMVLARVRHPSLETKDAKYSNNSTERAWKRGF